MLQEMLARSQDLSMEAAIDRKKAQDACTNSSAEKNQELAALDLQIESLEAHSATAEVELAQLQASAVSLATDLTNTSSHLEAMRVEHEKRLQAFAQDLTDFNVAIGTLDQALELLGHEAVAEVAVDEPVTTTNTLVPVLATVAPTTVAPTTVAPTTVAPIPGYSLYNIGGFCTDMDGEYLYDLSGDAADAAACKAKCDAAQQCTFLSFCPSGTAGCEDWNENKCALFSACNAWTTYLGYTTYAKAVQALLLEQYSGGSIGRAVVAAGVNGKSAKLSERALAAARKALATTRASRQALRTRRYQPESGGMIKDEHIFDEFGSLGEATAPYSGGGATSIEELLVQLRTSFSRDREALVNTEKARRSSFLIEEKSLLDQVKTTRSAQSSGQGSVAEKKEDLAAKQQELAEKTSSRTSTAVYLEKLTQACTAKEQRFAELKVIRDQEVLALGKAIDIITGQVAAAAAKHLPALLRLRTAAAGPLGAGQRLSASSGPGAQKLLGFLRLEAQKLKSPPLVQLAKQVSDLIIGGEAEPTVMFPGAAVSYFASAGSLAVREDPLAKVKTMIQDLIVKLQTQATEETSHKAWCDGELAKNGDAREGAQASLKKSSAKAAQVQGSLAKIELELEAVNATLAAGILERAALVARRNNESLDNLAAVEDSETSAEAVDAAIAILQEFFVNATSEKALSLWQASSSGTSWKEPLPAAITGAMAGPLVEQGKGVVAMLEVVRDNFRTLAQSTRRKEVELARLSSEALQAHDVMMAASQKDQDYMLAQKSQLLSDLAESHLDINASTQSLTDAQATYEELKPPCLNTPDYEERKAQRDEEVNALNEAYEMLEQYYPSAVTATLLQETNTTESDGAQLQDIAKLLTEIRAEVLSDLADDLQVFDDMAQWCQTTISEKQAALAAAGDRESQLVTQIETTAMEKARLEVEVEKLQKELVVEQASSDQQNALRQKDLELFRASEKELLESISSLSNAITVLSSHYNGDTSALNATEEQERLKGEKEDLYAGTGLLGNGTAEGTTLVRVAAEVRKALKFLPAGDAAINFAEGNAVLQEFLRSPLQLLAGRGDLAKRETLAQTASMVKGGAVVDGPAIFGILQQLLDTFRSDLAAAQAKEAADVSTFVALQDSKKIQIEALAASLVSKQEQLAHAETCNADAKEDLAYLRTSLQADQDYLASVQKHCAETAEEFQFRNMTRHSEMLAIDEAIQVLTAGAGVTASVATASTQLLLHKGQAAASAATQSFLRRRPSSGALAKAPAPKVSAAHLVDEYLRKHRRSHQAMAASTAASPRSGSIPSQAAVAATAATAVGAGHRRGPGDRLANIAAPWRAGTRLALPAALSGAVLMGGNNSTVMTASVSTRHHAEKILAVLTTRAHLGETPASGSVSAAFLQALDEVLGKVGLMRKALEEEKQLEVKMRDTCIDEKAQAELQYARRQHDDTSHTAEIQRLTALIQSTDVEVTTIQGEITALNNSVGSAETGRSEEYHMFQASVRQQEAHQAKLRTAMQFLSRHYMGKTAAAATALLQLGQSINAPTGNVTENSSVPAAPTVAPKPAGFTKPLRAHEGGAGILSILQILIDDSEKMLEALVRAEEAARGAYSGDLASTQRSLEEKGRQLIVLQEASGNARLRLQESRDAKTLVLKEMEEIIAFLGVVATKCTSLLQHFEASQVARAAELENLSKIETMARARLMPSTGSTGTSVDFAAAIELDARPPIRSMLRRQRRRSER